MKKSLKSFCYILLLMVAVLSLVACAKSKEDSTKWNGSKESGTGKESSNQNTDSDTSDNITKTESKKDSMADGTYVGEMPESDYYSEDGSYPDLVIPFSTEEYNYYVENTFLSVKDTPVSTFSVDVDTASYSNIRRMITNNEYIPKEAVRIEEMLNYFQYDYVKPEGSSPLSIHNELSYCPWNPNSKLLLVGLQAKEIDIKEKPKSNIVLLIDVSGSMESDDKLPLLKNAFTLFAENLDKNDRLSIVTYSGVESIALEGAYGNEKTKIIRAINKLEAEGSTAGEAGIKMAYALAEKHFIKGGNNRIIMGTDGDLNVGISSESELTSLIEEKRETGIFLSVLGVGTGNMKDNKLEALADNGNGEEDRQKCIAEAKRVLVDELLGTLYTVAKDVKIQIEFNPTKIKGYRLIGYENRSLETRDFDDDKKDAGDMGAGHSVTALYEIIEITSKQDVPSSNLKYQSEQYTDSKEWMTIKVRYKHPQKEDSKLISATIDESIYSKKLSKNLSLASGVASFGMILKDSEYKGNATYDMVLELLGNYNQSANSVDELKTLVKMVKDRY